MPNSKLILIVEGDFDAKFVQSLFIAAKIPAGKIDIVTANSKSCIKRVYDKMRSHSDKQIAILADLDYHSNYHPEDIVREELHLDEYVNLFCAVPTIEAWLFADIEAARRKLRNKKRGDEILNRIPLPDEIPYPKHLAKNLFTWDEKFEMMAFDVDLVVATSRSPSLKKFLQGISRLLNITDIPYLGQTFERSVGRDLFSTLLDEVAPPESIVYRTLDGTQVSAREMVRNVREGTDLGFQYSSDLLRVARDFVAREARRGGRG